MFCTKCGNQLKGNEKFCSRCGNSVSNKISTQESNNGFNIFTPEVIGNPFEGYEELSKLKNNSIFNELFNPSGRRNRTKYIIIFIIAFFVFYMSAVVIGYKSSEFMITVRTIVRSLMIYICFVNLSKRLHDFNHSAGWAIPILGFSYLFYYVMLPKIYYDMFFAYSHEIKFLKIMAHVCMVLTVLPHVLVYFIKGTVGVNEYGREE